MIHVVCYPSADPATGVAWAIKWIERGYWVLMMLDEGQSIPEPAHNRLYWYPASGPFLGYYRHINSIVVKAFGAILKADLVTCAADDMDPPEQGADEVARMYFERFPDGFGVLQGTGDPQGVDSSGLCAAARICGSPTFGRGWWKRAYGGRGPFCEDYGPYYGDEDLFHVAKLSGVLWQEPAITIYHRHWSFGHRPIAPHNERAQKNWDADKATFFRRQSQGFPGWEPV